jgi:hypothetical protein
MFEYWTCGFTARKCDRSSKLSSTKVVLQRSGQVQAFNSVKDKRRPAFRPGAQKLRDWWGYRAIVSFDAPGAPAVDPEPDVGPELRWWCFIVLDAAPLPFVVMPAEPVDVSFCIVAAPCGMDCAAPVLFGFPCALAGEPDDSGLVVCAATMVGAQIKAAAIVRLRIFTLQADYLATRKPFTVAIVPIGWQPERSDFVAEILRNLRCHQSFGPQEPGDSLHCSDFLR